MVTNKTYEYGIKYQLYKIDNNRLLMIPSGIEGGLSDGKLFSTGERMIPLFNDIKASKYKYVIDNVFTTDDLEKMYDYSDDTEFLANYFYNDFKDTFYIVKVDEEGKIKKYEFDLNDYEEIDNTLIYQMNKEKPSITLNKDLLNELLTCDSIEEIKVLLKKYKFLVNKFGDYSKETGVTRVHVRDGEVSSFDTIKKIVGVDKDIKINYNKSKAVKEITTTDKEITYNGLVSAIKEKIVGHDESINKLADILFMNFTAEEKEPVESILLVGPTGTGKTATIKVACDYLELPFVHVNTANLVPSGIKGYTIEKAIKDLYDKSNGDLKKAQRGVIFFDEFDKLGRTSLDLKEPIKDILLSISDGAEIPVNLDDIDFIFDSKMTNRIYVGVFQDIYEQQKTMGFGSKNEKVQLLDGEVIRQKIIDKKYYTLEDLSRITTVLLFEELTREEKKRILLTSKLSAYALKKERYKRQFGVELVASDDYIDTLLDRISSLETGMRSVNNIVKNSIYPAEIEILKDKDKEYKKLVLTKNTILDSKKFDLY